MIAGLTTVFDIGFYSEGFWIFNYNIICSIELHTDTGPTSRKCNKTNAYILKSCIDLSNRKFNSFVVIYFACYGADSFKFLLTLIIISINTMQCSKSNHNFERL